MKRRTPHMVRAVLAAVLAMVAVTAISYNLVALVVAASLYQKLVTIALAVLVAGAGSYCIQQTMAAAFNGLQNQMVVVARNLSTWTLYALLLVFLLQQFGVNLSGLLLGGALLGVVIATVSQASLSNFFAGLLLIGIQPYSVGNSLRLRSSMAGGAEYEGTVTDVGAMFTTLLTAQGETLKIPNSAIMTAALIVGQEPLQAEIEVEVPPSTALEPIAEEIRARLQLPAGAVVLRPRTFSLGDQTRLVCRLEIRSRRPIDSSVLAALLESTVGRGAAA